MGTYVTIASIRRTCGIAVAEINDVDVEATITEVEKQVSRFFNTQFAPTEIIEIANGDGTNRHLLDYNPVLSVRALKIDGTTEDTANLEVYTDSGYIYLGQSATTSVFTTKRNSVVIKYIYGTLVYSTTNTTTSAAITAGTAVSVGVADETGFLANDWIEIVGMDGHREAAKINSVSADTMILDKVILTHESGSVVTKLEIDVNFKKLMNIICSIALVARIIGQSYSDIVGYTLGELHVQKGEPYTQWRETANQLIRERDEIMARISIRPRIV